jgi:hypothetical protein
MEWWNDGAPQADQKDLNHFNFIVKMNFTINPTFHYPRTHDSNIPEFQHSNWGEAPDL